MSDTEALEPPAGQFPDRDMAETTQACPKTEVHIGVFFDGTNNNDENVTAGLAGEGISGDGAYENYHTNVVKLSRLYFGNGNNVENQCDGFHVAYEKIYVEGVATQTNGETSLPAGATAGGDLGIEQKLNKGIREFQAALANHAGPSLGEVFVDVFGFSRGAATARIFCNMLADMEVQNLTIRFLGLFDTVGSIGAPGNSYEASLGQELWRGYCVTIGILNPTCRIFPEIGTVYDTSIKPTTAEKVYQIGAMDELRAFFPLSSVNPSHGVEVMMPGAHGDVGGNVSPTADTTTYTNPPVTYRMRGFFDEAVDRSVQVPGYQNVEIYERTVQPGLNNIALHVMYRWASDSDVPLSPISAISGQWDISMPGPISSMYGTMVGGNTPSGPVVRLARTRYAHISSGGWHANRIELDQTRDIYPNP